MLQYHNITPAHFFAPYDANMFRLASIGRQELATLVGHVDLALGDSDFNRAGARGAGLRADRGDADRGRPRADHRRAARPALARILEDGLINFLFVGRIAPNKKIEDHIRLAEHYKRYVDVYYRFIFVGKCDAVPAYYRTIRALMLEYDMPKDRFFFTGPVPNEDLAAYYRHADVYISLSEHEGFCVPLLEAMAADVPVLAYGAAARCPKRWAAPASSSTRRISSSPPSGSACWPMTARSAAGSSRASARGSPTSATRGSSRELDGLIAEFE